MSARACERLVESLPAFVAGETPVAQSAAVRHHLRDCSACRQEASVLLQARRALDRHATTVREDLVGEAQFATWREDILAAVQRTPVAMVREPLWSSSARRRAAVAAACALVFGAYFGSLPEGGLFERAPIEARGDVDAASTFLLPLGQERWLSGSGGADAASSPAHGLMGRLSLRTLEDESLPILLEDSVLPARAKARAVVDADRR